LLTTHHSNQLEILAEALAARLAQDPLPPMAAETVVVPHRSMAHWLSLMMAERLGIAANVEFPFLGGMVWRLFRSQWAGLPERSPFDREALRWRVLGCIPELLGRPEFAPLRGYLADAEHVNGPKAYQLADRLAGLYDEYLVYRPDWITDWEAGNGTHWQAELWRALVRIDGRRQPHRASLLADYLALLADGTIDSSTLPPRLSVFGVSSAPPAYLDCLAQLARHIDVDVYTLNPCLHYWGDVVSERGLAKLRALWRRRGLADASEYYSVGNPLLSSLGRTGRDFLELLQERSDDEEYGFTEPRDGPLSHLERLQTDILTLCRRGAGGDDPAAIPLSSGDESVALHACHSPMREVQVLHDHLRRIFASEDVLPRDVVVMTPDIDRYAPYIEAVFGNARGPRYIPWSITDRSLPGVHPAIQVFSALLDLPRSRLGASEVLSLIEVPAVHRAFDLDADAIERVRSWIRESGIRWGADNAHRVAEGLPAGRNAHSWRFGLNRLMLGYAMDDDTPLYEGIAPLTQVEGADAASLGAFMAFWDRLLEARTELAGERGAEDWQAILNALLERLFSPADEAEHQALQSVRDAVSVMVETAQAAHFDGTLPLQTVRTHLLDALDHDAVGGGYLTGQVTFCAMVPMRSVPFEVVCLIGLNDQDFPRQSAPMAFDLMAGDRRRGDRSLREDDRYLFLEALLSARRRFHVSYIGRGIRDDAQRLPSVLVNELNDALDRTFDTGQAASASALLLTVHPLQPFSAQYGAATDPRVFSYADDWLADDTEAGTESAHVGDDGFLDADLPEPEAELREVPLEELVRFFRNPAEAFLRIRLGTRVAEGSDADEDSEPFDIDGLDAYQLRRTILDQSVKGASSSDIEAVLEASGALPEGAFRTAVMDDTWTRVEPLLRELGTLHSVPEQPLEIDLRLGDFALTGWITELTRDGRFTYRPGRIGGADLLRVWINHLALNAVAPATVARTSQHLGEGDRDGTPADVRFRPLDADEARTELETLLSLYWQGLHSPLPLFPETSMEFATRVLVDGTDEDDALDRARRGSWESNSYQGRRGDGDEPSVAVAFRGLDPLEDTGFRRIALTVFEPLINTRETE